jgi:hypothetical protein
MAKTWKTREEDEGIGRTLPAEKGRATYQEAKGIQLSVARRSRQSRRSRTLPRRRPHHHRSLRYVSFRFAAGETRIGFFMKLASRRQPD